jgi:hypothetical protein
VEAEEKKKQLVRPPKGWWERCLRNYQGATALNWPEVE